TIYISSEGLDAGILTASGPGVFFDLVDVQNRIYAPRPFAAGEPLPRATNTNSYIVLTNGGTLNRISKTGRAGVVLPVGIFTLTTPDKSIAFGSPYVPKGTEVRLFDSTGGAIFYNQHPRSGMTASLRADVPIVKDTAFSLPANSAVYLPLDGVLSL